VTSMDLVDLIEEKRFLGQEFLTWLWFKSDERGGAVFVPSLGSDVGVVFEKHMLLEYGEGEAFEKVIVRGLTTELKEARTGLAMGKKLEQARIRLVRDDHEFHFTFRASRMEYASVRLPKTASPAEEEEGPDAMAGRIIDQASLFETVAKTMDQLFKMFLTVRLGPDWAAELAAIQRWVAKARPHSEVADGV